MGSGEQRPRISPANTKHMANALITYLCGGTFLAQVLRAKIPSTAAAEHLHSKKESLPEREVFRRLISIYQLNDFYAYEGDSLRTNTSRFKSCQDSLEAFTLISDNDMRRAFDEDVRSSPSIALAMMSDFVRDCVDPGKYLQLVRCLLDMIRSDGGNLDRALFFLFGDSEPITGKELCAMDRFAIESFLLGVWHFIIMNRSGSNEKGAATYRQWYPSGKDYRGTIGNGITKKIHVNSVPAEYPEHFRTKSSDMNAAAEKDDMNTSEDNDENARAMSQIIEHATIVNQYGGKNIHIDHVDTLNL